MSAEKTAVEQYDKSSAVNKEQDENNAAVLENDIEKDSGQQIEKNDNTSEADKGKDRNTKEKLSGSKIKDDKDKENKKSDSDKKKSISKTKKDVSKNKPTIKEKNASEKKKTKKGTAKKDKDKKASSSKDTTKKDTTKKDTTKSETVPPNEGDDEKNYIRCNVTIDCGILLSNMDKLDKNARKYVPENGKLLEKTSIMVKKGASAYDVLTEACKQNKIAYDAEYSPVYKSSYVKGIGYLYEKMAGDMSGWLYRVDGKTPNVGASAYKLKDGESVEWLYTCSGRAGS